jgi:hypothetical protein
MMGFDRIVTYIVNLVVSASFLITCVTLCINFCSNLIYAIPGLLVAVSKTSNWHVFTDGCVVVTGKESAMADDSAFECAFSRQ